MSHRNRHQLYVERRPVTNDYAVRRGESKRASAICETQAAAIARAKELEPKSTPMVERVRHTSGGGPEKWRSP